MILKRAGGLELCSYTQLLIFHVRVYSLSVYPITHSKQETVRHFLLSAFFDQMPHWNLNPLACQLMLKCILSITRIL